MSVALQPDRIDHLVVHCEQDHSELLRDYVRDAVDNYFSQLNGHAASGLYQMVLSEVEQPLIEAVLRQVGSNQTRAARVLGISRGTLRKKLVKYNLE